MPHSGGNANWWDIAPRQVVLKSDVPPFDASPFKPSGVYLFLGEVKDMPGHGVFVDDDGITHYGYHIDHFEPYDLI